MGGRSFFRHRPDARASWVAGGPAAHADGWARELSLGRQRAEGAMRSVVRTEAGREVPGLVLVQAYVRVETAGAWPVRRVGFGGRMTPVGRRPSAAGRGPACHTSGWRRASPQSASTVSCRFPKWSVDVGAQLWARASGPVRLEKEPG